MRGGGGSREGEANKGGKAKRCPKRRLGEGPECICQLSISYLAVYSAPPSLPLLLATVELTLFSFPAFSSILTHTHAHTHKPLLCSFSLCGQDFLSGNWRLNKEAERWWMGGGLEEQIGISGVEQRICSIESRVICSAGWHNGSSQG